METGGCFCRFAGVDTRCTKATVCVRAAWRVGWCDEVTSTEGECVCALAVLLFVGAVVCLEPSSVCLAVLVCRVVVPLRIPRRLYCAGTRHSAVSAVAGCVRQWRHAHNVFFFRWSGGGCAVKARVSSRCDDLGSADRVSTTARAQVYYRIRYVTILGMRRKPK